MAMVPVILAGGVGERLWPLSRSHHPKQFISLDDSGLSLFQATVARVADAEKFAPPLIVTNHEQRFMVAEQLREMDAPTSGIILEPEAKNTAASVLFAALHVAKTQADALMLVLPSDHHIADATAFLGAVADARGAAENGRIVAFSITPAAPETGYGYTKLGAPLADYFKLHRMDGFVEKPTRERAQALIDAGNVGFNSGMFLARADVLIAQFQRHAPEIYAACAAASNAAQRDGDFLHLDAAVFAPCPAMPFDIAVMERTDMGAVLPVDMGWSDVGAWNVIDALAEKSPQGNATRGNVHLRDAQDCYVYSDQLLVAVLGVRDLLVVACENALLVADKSRVDEIKPLLTQLRATSAQADAPRVTYRPWGKFYTITMEDGYQVKRLHIHPHAQISLQTHQHRSEHWVVVRGTATVQRGDATLTLRANESVSIEAGQRHRLQNLTDAELVIVEVQTGDDLREDDIIRHEDMYDRV